jgi:AcrR family transcriptional regulator
MTEPIQHKSNPRIARTRARVLEATLELAADSGLQACTFDAVSERSGVARSTLYRHWSNQAELVMEAIQSQEVKRVAPNTGNLRDDMLNAMLELGRGLEDSLWGGMVPQLVAAAYIDPEMSNANAMTMVARGPDLADSCSCLLPLCSTGVWHHLPS